MASPEQFEGEIKKTPEREAIEKAVAERGLSDDEAVINFLLNPPYDQKGQLLFEPIKEIIPASSEEVVALDGVPYKTHLEELHKKFPGDVFLQQHLGDFVNYLEAPIIVDSFGGGDEGHSVRRDYEHLFTGKARMLYEFLAKNKLGNVYNILTYLAPRVGGAFKAPEPEKFFAKHFGFFANEDYKDVIFDLAKKGENLDHSLNYKNLSPEEKREAVKNQVVPYVKEVVETALKIYSDEAAKREE